MRYESPYGQTIHLDIETYLSLTDEQLSDLCVNMTRYNQFDNVRIGNSPTKKTKEDNENKKSSKNNLED